MQGTSPSLARLPLGSLKGTCCTGLVDTPRNVPYSRASSNQRGYGPWRLQHRVRMASYPYDTANLAERTGVEPAHGVVHPVNCFRDSRTCQCTNLSELWWSTASIELALLLPVRVESCHVNLRAPNWRWTGESNSQSAISDGYSFSRRADLPMYQAHHRKLRTTSSGRTIAVRCLCDLQTLAVSAGFEPAVPLRGLHASNVAD